MFGELLHFTLEKILFPFQKKILDEEDYFESLLKNHTSIDRIIAESINAKFYGKKKNILSGMI